MADRPAPPSVPSAGRAAPSGAVQLLQIGATWGVFVGLGVLVGYLLDRVAGTTPLLVFAGLAVGIVGAATGSYFLIRPYLAIAPTGVSHTKAAQTARTDVADASPGASDVKD